MGKYSRSHVFCSPEKGLENLRSVLHRSIPSEIVEGSQYWVRMHDRISEMAVAYGSSIYVAAGVFCALSPNNSEKSNLRDCEAMLRLGESATVHTYPAHKAKALEILHGNAWPDAVLGIKTRSMWHNIIDPDNPDWVTVDGHMLCCWQCQRMTLDMAKINPREYAVVQAGITTLARSKRMVPCALQAALWLTWKRLHRILYSQQVPFEFAVY